MFGPKKDRPGDQCAKSRSQPDARPRPEDEKPRNGDRHQEEGDEDEAVGEAERRSSGSAPAVAAGLGLTIRTDIGLPSTVRAMTPEVLGLPALPEMALFLHRKEAEPDPVAARLADILLQAALESLPENAQARAGLRSAA